MSADNKHAGGPPDLQIAGLKLWIQGRQFPHADDYWDGNWLNVTVECRYPKSSVRAHGSIVHLGEIQTLLNQTEVLYRTLEGEARLPCIEPNLSVSLRALADGHVEVTLSVTPDPLAESHTYTDLIDQTFLPAIIAQCQAILQAFPPRE